MNHARTTLMASLFALIAASVWGAQAPLDADGLKKGATNIVSGTVGEVAVTTQKTKLKSERGLFNRDRVFSITVKVATVSKGSDVKPGEEITIVAWQAQRRWFWHAGPQGHGPIPAKGDKVTVYLDGRDGNAHTPVLPNGIAIDDDKGEGVQSKTRPDRATSLTHVLDNPKFTLVSSETSHFSLSPVNSNIIYCEKNGVMSMDRQKRQAKTLLESPQPGDYLWAWMSPDGKRLLVLSRNLKLVLVDIGTGKKIPLKEDLPKGFKRCVFSPDGTYFVAIGGMEDSVLLYWELDEDKTTIKTSGTSTLADRNTLYDCAFSPDGKTFATVSGSGLVDFWSRPPMRPVRRGTSITRNGGLSGIAFSSDGKFIAAAAAFDSVIALIDSPTGKVVKQIEWKKGHPLSGRKLAFLPGTNVLATADGDKIGFLDTDSGRSLGSVPAGGIVKSLEVSPDGHWLVAGTRNKSLVLWRLEKSAKKKK